MPEQAPPVVVDPELPYPLPAISGPPPHPSCEPLYPCASLDGQLLINRVLHGPALGYEEAEIPFGTLRLRQLNNFAYFEACVNAVWTPMEACYGPMRSIFGLAPGETVTLHVRDRREESRDERGLTHLSHAESEVEREGSEVVSNTFDSAVISQSSSTDVGWTGGSRSSSETYQILLKSIETEIEEKLTSISDSEISEEVLQVSTKAQVERGIARTFTNPYRDRSLELRFIPVFRKFRVTWDIRDCSVGVVVTAQQVEFPEQGTMAQYGRFIQDNLIDPRVLSVSGAELMEPGEDGPRTKTSALHDHLNAYPYLYTKRFLRHAASVGERPLLEAPRAARNRANRRRVRERLRLVEVARPRERNLRSVRPPVARRFRSWHGRGCAGTLPELRSQGSDRDADIDQVASRRLRHGRRSRTNPRGRQLRDRLRRRRHGVPPGPPRAPLGGQFGRPHVHARREPSHRS